MWWQLTVALRHCTRFTCMSLAIFLQYDFFQLASKRKLRSKHIKINVATCSLVNNVMLFIARRPSLEFFNISAIHPFVALLCELYVDI